MAKKIHKRGPVAPTMNITPLIDVVFLLIIFFMIVSRIVSEQREPMIVPKLTNPEAKQLETENRVIVNVTRRDPNVNKRKEQMGGGESGHLAGPGMADYVKVGFERYAMSELDRVTQVLSRRREANPDLKVLLRADAGLYYNQVAPVMNAITSARVSRVNMVAYTKEQPF